LSVQVLQEFYVSVTRKVAHPLSPEQAASTIADLAVWHVHRPGAEDVLDAIRLQERYQTSFWDAMIVTSAIQLGCEVLWSEDLNAGQVYDTVRVVNPF
jgi:predicted nucleic acid-binding protein